jgi:hypothetical protein
MSAMKRTMRHLEDDELNDELDHITVLMLGEYQKRKNKQ